MKGKRKFKELKDQWKVLNVNRKFKEQIVKDLEILDILDSQSGELMVLVIFFGFRLFV